MSIEAVREFMKKAEHDASLQKKLQSFPKGGGQGTIAGIVKMAGDAGFTFSALDYEKAVDQMLAEKHAAGALNDAELALISGGLMCVSSDNTHCKCCTVQTPPPGTQHPVAI